MCTEQKATGEYVLAFFMFATMGARGMRIVALSISSYKLNKSK